LGIPHRAWTQPYFWRELQQGRLRQGWGYHEDQNLQTVAQLSWQDQKPDQRVTSRQRRMLGGKDGWQEGDIVLVPNMPKQGMFALV